MAKSTQTITRSLSGLYDMEAGTITNYAKKEEEEDKVYYVENTLRMYHGKEVTFTYKETSELESED